MRLPLASGLLTGKFTETTTFSEGDHRNFNANGEQFNVGETFAGLRFEKGLSSPELAWIAEGRGDMARASMRWILDCPEVTAVIPGFRNVRQIEDNLGTLDVPSFSMEEKERLALLSGAGSDAHPRCLLSRNTKYIEKLPVIRGAFV